MKRLWGVFHMATLFLVGSVVVLVGFSSHIPRLTERAIELNFEKSTDTRVSVGRVSLTPPKSTGSLVGFSIANPPGFETAYALQINALTIDVDLESAATDVLVVRSIAVDGATLNAERRGASVNLARLLGNVRLAALSSEGEDRRRVVVDSFSLDNAHMVITDPTLRRQTLTLDRIAVRDVGRAAGGVSYEEAVDQIVTAVFSRAYAAMIERVEAAARTAGRDEGEAELPRHLDQECLPSQLSAEDRLASDDRTAGLGPTVRYHPRGALTRQSVRDGSKCTASL